MASKIEHQGIVSSVENGKATIVVQTGGCSGCGHLSGCGIGKLAGGKASAVMEVDVDRELRPGDRVALEMSQEQMLRAVLLGYLLPATTLLLGAGSAFAGFGTDGATAVGALGGLAAGVILTRVLPGWTPKPEVLPLGRYGPPG